MENQYEVYRIIANDTNEPQGVYSRAYHDDYDFGSIESARNSNCHGIYKDKGKYKIARYRVTYELIDDDCDPITEEDLIEINKKKKQEELERQQKEQIAMKVFSKKICDLTIKEYSMVVALVFFQSLNDCNGE